MEKTKPVKKRGCFIGKVFKLAFFIMAVRGIVLTVKEINKKLTKKMEEENAGKEKKIYPCILTGKNITFSEEEAPDIEIYCAFSGVSIDLTKAVLRKDTYITIHTALGGVEIKVPPLVRVKLEQKNLAGGVANMVPEYENEEYPLIHIHADLLLSGINVKVDKTEEAERAANA